MQYLDNVPTENAFVLSNGKRILNLEELYLEIMGSVDAIFYYHVNDQRNDFANWIKYVINDEALYKKIVDVRDRKKFIEILASEIEYIKNPRLKDTAAFFSENMEDPTENIVDNSSVANNEIVNSSSAGSSISSASSSIPTGDSLSSENISSSNKKVSGSVNDSIDGSNNNPSSSVLSPASKTGGASVSGDNIIASDSNNPASDSGNTQSFSFSDLEQVLSLIITDINNEILSWNE